MNLVEVVPLLDMPIPILTCSGTPELVVHRKGSYGYLLASTTAFSCTSPAPAFGILVRYAD